jgi:hypothetical protein
MYLCAGSPDFFFRIWTTQVIPNNALNSEFANFETPCIIIIPSLINLTRKPIRYLLEKFDKSSTQM